MVGNSYQNPADPTPEAILWHSEQGIIALGTLGGVEMESMARSINNRGQIVGVAMNVSGDNSAILFDSTGGGNNIDLNNLIDPTLGWKLTEAMCINDDGWIVGTGYNPAGDQHAYLLTPVPEPAIEAEIDIDPHTLNLSSKGKWITCYVWLPEDYDVADIDPNSVFLEDGIRPVSFRVNEQEQVAIAKFNRSDVQGILNVGQVELTITGQLTDGTVFEGTDAIRVIDKGQKSAK